VPTLKKIEGGGGSRWLMKGGFGGCRGIRLDKDLGAVEGGGRKLGERRRNRRGSCGKVGGGGEGGRKGFRDGGSSVLEAWRLRLRRRENILKRGGTVTGG